MTTARLIGVLRERYPEASVADVYQNPGLCALAARLAELNEAQTVGRPMHPTPGRTGLVHPPVTGLAELGDGCAIEPEANLAGWWLDGDMLHVGTVSVGAGARLDARTTLMPGARLGDHAEVEAGSSVPAGCPPVNAGVACRPDGSATRTSTGRSLAVVAVVGA